MLRRCRLQHVEHKNQPILLASVRRKPVFLICLALLSVHPEPSAAFATARTRILQRQDQPKTLSRSCRHYSTQQPKAKLITLFNANANALSDEISDAHPSEEEVFPGVWPCFDELDSKLIKIALPVIANFAINPLIGAVDLFWINRMGNALAVAGQSAANQVCTLLQVYWLFTCWRIIVYASLSFSSFSSLKGLQFSFLVGILPPVWSVMICDSPCFSSARPLFPNHMMPPSFGIFQSLQLLYQQKTQLEIKKAYKMPFARQCL
jgi:hypothetical protein